MTKDLYDQDYYLWVMRTIELLNQKKFSELDLTNLVEEIEDMGKSEKKSITSNLRILLMHLLKYKYQSDKQTNSWLFTIVEHRKRLQEAFKVSPSLRCYYEEVFLDCYQDARELASAETGLSMQIFSEVCPFTPEEALNSSYLP
jgi:hypothetical protein